jgi:protease I
VSVDATTSEVSADDFDAIIIPGGYAPDKVTEQPEALYLVWDLFERGGIVALSYHDGWVPFTAGMLKGRRVTSPRALRELLKDAGAEWVDEDVVRDGNLITARGTDELPAFCRAIVAALTDEAEEGLVPQATLHVESKPVVMR